MKDIETDEPAQATLDDTGVGFADNRLKEVVVADGENTVMMCGCVQHPLCLHDRKGHRFFDKHVSARLEGRTG
jgi:hypothetical protein